MMQIVRCTNTAHLGLECGKEGNQIVMQAEDFHWDMLYENGTVATVYHALCRPLSAALQEYATTIDSIEAQLREQALGLHVSTRFDSDTTSQKFVVHFAAAPFTLLVEKSAFEALEGKKL